MNKKLILRILGLVLCVEALCMLAPLAVSIIAGSSDLRAFLLSIAACFGVGFPLSRLRITERMQARDGFAAAAIIWIVLSAFGALPYVFSGVVPNYADAFFETVSGFTTTGASVFAAPSQLPRGIQFWRALTQWMGGMGVLVLVLALLPKLGEGSVNLMRAESPGPVSAKLLPRTSDTAKILYGFYIGLTVAETIALRIANVPWFDSVTTALTTISTGGFSIRDESIAYYQSEAVVWIIIVFLLLASTNFSVFFLLVRRRFKDALKNEELRVYALIVGISVLLIAADLVCNTGSTMYRAVSDAGFQVASLISTAGYITADYDVWPTFSKVVLILIMFIGGCAGSTAGGLKVSRIIILFKGLRRDLHRVLHTRSVRALSLDGQRVEEGTVSSISLFFFIYMCITLLCTAVIALDGASLAGAFSAALTSISNVGPGLAELGPVENFSAISSFGKYVMSFTMLLGRLEIIPMLMLMLPELWQSR